DETLLIDAKKNVENMGNALSATDISIHAGGDFINRAIEEKVVLYRAHSTRSHVVTQTKHAEIAARERLEVQTYQGNILNDNSNMFAKEILLNALNGSFHNHAGSVRSTIVTK